MCIRDRLEGHLGAVRHAPQPSGHAGAAARGHRAQPARGVPRRRDPRPATAAAAVSSGLMLSRIAESLYWIGRYVERADGTARIVDVVRLSLLETTKSEAAELVLSMIMGIEPSSHVTFDEVRDRLVFDAGNPSSIAGSWYAARENARRARAVS